MFNLGLHVAEPLIFYEIWPVDDRKFITVTSDPLVVKEHLDMSKNEDVNIEIARWVNYSYFTKGSILKYIYSTLLSIRNFLYYQIILFQLFEWMSMLLIIRIEQKKKIE